MRTGIAAHRAIGVVIGGTGIGTQTYDSVIKCGW